jgi:hypothetical protein
MTLAFRSEGESISGMTRGIPEPKATAGAFCAAMLGAQLLMTLALASPIAIHLVLGSRHFWAFWIRTDPTAQEFCANGLSYNA